MISLIRLDRLRRVEWIVAILLSLMVLLLIAVRLTHAGALWRDESAVVQLARMPHLGDIARNFQHEAFPIPFPILIRGYTDLFGTNDTALRAFGAVVGVALLCALWFSAACAGERLPLISLSLLGLNTTFLVWGLTIRGYGLGSVFIALAFGLFAGLIRKPFPTNAVAAALVSVAAVQCLVHNLVLLVALTLSAAAVCLIRRNFRNLAVFFRHPWPLRDFLPALPRCLYQWQRLEHHSQVYGYISSLLARVYPCPGVIPTRRSQFSGLSHL
jgi:hypothetical protein